MKQIRTAKSKPGARRTLSGDSLWKSLGFNNVRAFQRARERGQLSLPMYPAPGTRGVFAYAEDVKQYLAERQATETPSDPK